jgi:hypothetical protein
VNAATPHIKGENEHANKYNKDDGVLVARRALHDLFFDLISLAKTSGCVGALSPQC